MISCVSEIRVKPLSCNKEEFLKILNKLTWKSQLFDVEENLKMSPFKICSKCAYAWKGREDFLKDPFICLVGFQGALDETESAFYLFNHILDGDQCNTTLMLNAEDFLPLYKGTMFKDLKFKSPECEGHCTRVEDLSRCPVECKNAVAREIMQAFLKC